MARFIGDTRVDAVLAATLAAVLEDVVVFPVRIIRRSRSRRLAVRLLSEAVLVEFEIECPAEESAVKAIGELERAHVALDVRLNDELGSSGLAYRVEVVEVSAAMGSPSDHDEPGANSSGRSSLARPMAAASLFWWMLLGTECSW